MSELDNITTLAGRFKSDSDLQEYCNIQFLTLQKAHERILQLEGEIKHLQELVSSTTQLTHKVETLIVPTEQAICEMQLMFLREESLKRPLTLEETKRLDLLVKNLYLAKGQSTAIITDFTRLPSGISEAKLMEIASLPDPNQIESD